MAMVDENTLDASPHARGQWQGITARSVLLGLVAAVAVSYYASMIELLRLGSVVKSSFPIAVILGFLFWVVINMFLARTAPAAMLTRVEMMVILSMMWVVSTMPGVGWTGYFIGALPAPHFFATPENRWAGLFAAGGRGSPPPASRI